MTTNALTIELASGEALDVREFSVEEGISRPFEVRLTAVSASPDVDFEAAIGGPARFEIHRTSTIDGDTRYWTGICASLEQIGAEEDGLSTYAARVVPVLWLLTQRRNYRVFQDKSELDIALEILAEWGIEPALSLDAGSYGKRRMRVQYAESDLDFISRLLEDIGVSYYFEQMSGDTRLVLADAPNRRAPRAPVQFVDKPNERVSIEYVTGVRTRRDVQPGRYTQSDVDYRKALNYPLAASVSKGNAIEGRLERYHHNYGSFLWKGQGGDTPVADDRGAARTNEREGARQVGKRIEAQRINARAVTFRTIAHDLRPGKVFTIGGHPRGEIGAPLLVVSGRFSGTPIGEWVHTCEARYTDVDYRPGLRTPKPRTNGVESATVTGPPGEEIHTDEFGRVRVHFHWDREGVSDQTSSCWIPVSQPWAGAGFGAINLPRVGQEVLVDFLGADPDRPIVIGRVFTTTTPPPYQLPKYKMVSGLRSETYPRPRAAGAAPRMGGDPAGASPEMQEDAPVMRLGGDGPGGAPPAAPEPAGPPREAMPGIFGGMQARPPELNTAIARMTSLGPDRRDQSRSANALVFDDSAGGERAYLQGQNDFFVTVKRNFTGSVGSNRAFAVLGNDYEEIPRGFQTTRVGRDRQVGVVGKQTHVVQGDIIVDGKSNHIIFTEQHFYSKSIEGSQVFEAKAGIMLRVGTTATVLLTPGSIVIDAPKVYINPGPEVMAAINAGQSPEEAVANVEREERINRALQAMLAETIRRIDYAQRMGRVMSEQERTRFDAEQSRILRATSRVGRSTPYGILPGIGNATNDEVREAARRAHETMYGPL